MPASGFEIKKNDSITSARLGILNTAHGKVYTPAFAPVITASLARWVNPSEMRFWGAEIAAVSTYHTSLAAGESAVRKAGGLHQFSSWPKAIITDSAGAILGNFYKNPYFFHDRAFAPKNITVTESGIAFQTGLDRNARTLSPEGSAQAQINFGSDILQDLFYFPKVSKSAQASAWLKATSDWLSRSYRQFKKNQTLSPGLNRLFFASVPGHWPKDAMARAAANCLKIPIDGYAIVGLHSGLPQGKLRKALATAVEKFPRQLPRQAVELESPEAMVAAAACGIDLFNSIAPNRLADEGLALVSARAAAGYFILNVRHARGFGSAAPLDSACECYACRQSSRGEISALYKNGDSVGKRMVLIHNLNFFLKLFEKMRRSIEYESFGDFQNNFKKRKNEDRGN